MIEAEARTRGRRRREGGFSVEQFEERGRGGWILVCSTIGVLQEYQILSLRIRVAANIDRSLDGDDLSFNSDEKLIAQCVVLNECTSATPVDRLILQRDRTQDAYRLTKFAT